MPTCLRLSTFGLVVVLLGSLPGLGQGVSSDLLELTYVRSGVQTKRVSSYDRSGGNNDRFENIPSGERRTLFEVEGSGIINHIWMTIAPPPPALNRHDIILRMYWDGHEDPCVETPLGPFFGQGWDESYPFSSLPLAAGPREGRGLVNTSWSPNSLFQHPYYGYARVSDNIGWLGRTHVYRFHISDPI